MKNKPILSLVFAILFSQPFFLSAQVQLAIIKDKDGFTNIRKEPSASAKIIEKLPEGRPFRIHPDDDILSKNNWKAIYFPSDKDNNIKSFSRFDDRAEGFLYRDRIQLMDDLPQLKFKQLNNENVLLTGKNTSIQLTTAIFKKQNHRLEKKNEQLFIDGKIPAGYYEGMPEPVTLIKSILISVNGKKITFPPTALSGIFSPAIARAQAFTDNNGNLYLSLPGGDGGESFQIVWTIKNGTLTNMWTFDSVP